jgi:hypothetical protein
MGAAQLRIVAALGAVLMLTTGSVAASADSAYEKHYVAAGGGPAAMGTPLAPCANDDVTPSLGGACFTVTGPTTVHVRVEDVASHDVAGYWNLGLGDHGYFCNETDIVVPDSESHMLGVWVGGVDTSAVSCGVGQATTGWIHISTSP